MADGPPPVRRLGLADAALLRDLRLEALRTHPEAFTAAFEDEAARPLDWFASRLETGFVFGAGSAERLDGMAGVYRPPGAKERHKAVLWGMYVRAAARGNGLAARLIARCIDFARTTEAEELTLGVGTYNAAAIRLYRAMGFRDGSVEPRALKIGERYVDEMRMSLPLR